MSRNGHALAQSLALFMLSGFCGAAHAQSFSADLVAFAAGGVQQNSGKVHVDGPKVRIDAPELPQGFFIDNAADKTAYYIRPVQYIYMDAKQSSQLTQLLVPLDGDAPCAQWQVMAKVADVPDAKGTWQCTWLGAETISGRKTFLYRVISPKGTSNLAWIDPELKFLIKYRNEDGSGLDVANIEKAPQDKALFVIPTNYEKFDPMELIERVKESDVWVEPPKQ